MIPIKFLNSLIKDIEEKMNQAQDTLTANSFNCDYEESLRRTFIRSFSKYLTSSPFPSSASLLKIISKLLLRKPKHIICAPVNHGFNMILNPDKNNSIDSYLYFEGSYKPGILNIISHILKNGDTFFDIGANSGFLSIYGAQQVGNSGFVYSFEPNSSYFDLLQKNIYINRLKNIFTHRGFLGNKLGTLNKKEFEAKIDTFDNFIEAKNINNIKLLKINAKNRESEILKGSEKTLKKNNGPNIYIECNSSQSIEIYEYLKSFENYRFFKLKSGVNKISELKEIKNKKDLQNISDIFCINNKTLANLPTSIFTN